MTTTAAHSSTGAPPAPVAVLEPTGWMDRLLRWSRGWSFVAVLFAGYVLFGLRALSDDRYLDDEGILTYLYAEYLRRDFATVLFWLKSHPALALLNLPGATLGLGGFFVLHVFIGALGLIFIAIAARRAGIREVGIAPLVFATSPLYVQGGASGIANVDGVALASGALALYLAPSPGFLAGLAAGVLPFVRFETGLLTLTLALVALTTPGRWRFLAGLGAAPLSYLAAGAVYHGTPAWFIEFPPAWGHWDPATFTVVAEGVERISAPALVRSIGLTLPALPLLLVGWGRPTTRRWLDLGLAAYVVAFVTAITVLPFARVAFGFDDRYYLTALPAVALLAARAVDSFGESETAGPGWMARTLVAAAAAAVASWCEAWGLAATAYVAAVTLAAGVRVRPAAAVVTASALMLFAGCLTIPRGYRWHAEMNLATSWLRDHRAEFEHVPIYTNLKLLSAFAARSGNAPGFDIVGLIQPDMQRELLEWTNPVNGQRERIWELAHEAFYGRGALPADILEGRAPPGSLLVLNKDDLRTDEMFPPSFLEAHTRTVAASRWLLVAVLRPPEASGGAAE